MRRGEAAIVDAGVPAPRLYRPPYGIFSGAGLLLARRRYQPLLWTRWGRDWSAGSTPASIAAKATERSDPGDVILLHDADHYSDPGSWRNTAEALPRILETLSSRDQRPIAVP
jgi:peptidoglycan/xylan/chitin deacetylase (PgdA/CDA1 family)